MVKGILLTVAALGAATMTYATEPSGYYSSCENKGGTALLSALCSKVGPHTTVSYDNLLTLYKTTDTKSNGKIWDMYSTKEWTYKTEQCGSYKEVGDCYNREHSFPKSWFNEASPMKSDAFHVYPTDGKVNGQRSNYPYGECANGTTLSSNGNVKALGKLGTSTFSGYTGKVFEPDDEYKGDFARSYFYMAAAYYDKVSGWTSDMLDKNSSLVFEDWAINLLLKWHRQDPVSQKELDRQEGVYASQKNRNPFIDHPEMVEYIWGDKKNESWSSSAASEPTISLPVNNTTIDLGAVGVGVTHTTNIEVKGSALTKNATVSVTGSGFSVSPTTLTASSINASEGTKIAVTLKAAQAGAVTGTLTITSGDAKSTVTLTATAYDGLPASAPTNITSESFTAHWTYVGMADSNGCYILNVTDINGDNVDTYPRSVTATAEEYMVDELSPETTYYYTISNGVLTSNVIEVTTGALMPNISLLHDGDLYLQTSPGEPSNAEEVLVDAENITDNITLTVNAPFELSSNKSTWARTLTIDAEEDRFYIRINGDTEGSYESEIIATAGDYTTDEAMVKGAITNGNGFIEDFEASAPGGYNNDTVTGTAATWAISNAGVYNASSEAYEGNNYLRFGSNSNSYAAMNEDKSNGAGIVSLYASGWSAKDGDAAFDLQYSTDGGETWTTAGSAEVVAPTGSTKSYAPYSFTVNKSGNVRIKLQQTSGQRMCIDYITISDYRDMSGALDGVTSDYKSWDAYCLNGELVIELNDTKDVAVHGVDGITYFRGTLESGANTISLAKGLYVIVVDDFTRRVLVK